MASRKKEVKSEQASEVKQLSEIEVLKLEMTIEKDKALKAKLDLQKAKISQQELVKKIKELEVRLIEHEARALINVKKDEIEELDGKALVSEEEAIAKEVLAVKQSRKDMISELKKKYGVKSEGFGYNPDTYEIIEE